MTIGPGIGLEGTWSLQHREGGGGGLRALPSPVRFRVLARLYLWRGECRNSYTST